MVADEPEQLAKLSAREIDALIEDVTDEFVDGLDREDFGDACLALLEHISGFETMSPKTATHVVNQLWSAYMAKKVSNQESQAEPANESAASSTEAPVVNLQAPAIQTAITQGKALIAEGKSKADAARSIFDAIKDESKEVIVAAFVEGATLTPKGALTYWYNCRRKASKKG